MRSTTEFESIGGDEAGWTDKRKVTIGAVLAGIMLVAVVVASSATTKNEHGAVLVRQAIEDAHPMYAGLQVENVNEDLSLAEEDYPAIWDKVRADATGDGFKELVMCGNTYGAHFFWNEWNGGAATIRNVAQHELLYVRMYDKTGKRVQSGNSLSNGNVFMNARANRWLNESPWNNKVADAKKWVNANWHGHPWLKDRMWWSCHTNRHQSLVGGKVYWACGHGSAGGGGLHVDKAAKNCIWQWQNRVKKDNLDQVFVFYKKATCRQ